MVSSSSPVSKLILLKTAVTVQTNNKGDRSQVPADLADLLHAKHYKVINLAGANNARGETKCSVHAVPRLWWQA